MVPHGDRIERDLVAGDPALLRALHGSVLDRASRPALALATGTRSETGDADVSSRQREPTEIECRTLSDLDRVFVSDEGGAVEVCCQIARCPFGNHLAAGRDRCARERR